MKFPLVGVGSGAFRDVSIINDMPSRHKYLYTGHICEPGIGIDHLLTERNATHLYSGGMDLEIRHLKYFVAVAEELSFTTAAHRLHMAQPPLSRAVKDLEKQLGVRLLERTTRSVELTAAGSVFLDEARVVIDRFEGALAHAAQAGRRENRTLRIGFRPAASLPLLEPLVREFRSRFPHMAVESARIEWTDQVSCLLTGRVDTAFVLSPLVHRQVEVTPLLAAPRAVAMPLDHRLADRPSLSIEDLRGEALAVPSGATLDWEQFWTASPRPIDSGVENPPQVANADESLAVVLSGRALVIAISTVMSYYRDGSLAIVPIVDIPPAVIGLASRVESEHSGVAEFRKVAIEMAEPLADQLSRDLGTTVIGPGGITPDGVTRPLVTSS